jgi:uncharacterized protein (DUF2236 family)
LVIAGDADGATGVDGRRGRPGPGSLTWRCASDTRGLLLAPATLILQVAHPVVGAGVSAHSNFTAAPWARLVRTIRSVDRVVFGPPDVAAAESRRLRRLHAAIRGVDGLGRPYHGLDPAAYAWVHLTLLQLFVDVQGVFGEPLTPDQVQTLYLEWWQVGRLLQVGAEHMPTDWAGFRSYFDDTVARTLEANRAVEDVLAAVAAPKSPWPVLPGPFWGPLAGRVGALSLLLSIGTLPPPLRERIGLSWGAEEQDQLERQASRLRTAFSIVPRPVWSLPPVMPYLIRARLGRWPDRAGVIGADRPGSAEGGREPAPAGRTGRSRQGSEPATTPGLAPRTPEPGRGAPPSRQPLRSHLREALGPQLR